MRAKTYLGKHKCGVPAYERGGMRLPAYERLFSFGTCPHMRVYTLAVAPIRRGQVCDEIKNAYPWASVFNE